MTPPKNEKERPLSVKASSFFLTHPLYLKRFRIDICILRVTSGLRPDELEPNEVVDQLPKFSFDGQRLQEDRLTQDEISLF